METFSALLALCAGNSPVPGEFPAQRQVTRNFDVFFDLCQDKHLSKQCRGWWFETPSCPLSWCHCIETGLLSALDDSQCRHYLNQCWLTVNCTPQIVMIIAHAMNFCERRDALSGLESCWNWVPIIGTTPRYKLGWNLNHTRKFVFHRNTIKIATIAFRPAYVNSLLGFVRTRVLMSRSRLNNGATHGGWHFDIHRDFYTRGR